MNNLISLLFVQGNFSSIPLESVVRYLDKNGEHPHDYHSQFNCVEYYGEPGG